MLAVLEPRVGLPFQRGMQRCLEGFDENCLGDWGFASGECTSLLFLRILVVDGLCFGTHLRFRAMQVKILLKV